MTQPAPEPAEDPLPPNPQFARPGWQDLTGTWRFDHDDADIGLRDGWHRPDHEFSRTIEVPFPPESELSGIGDTARHRVLWYQRQVSLRAEPGRRVLLHFGAVDHWCEVFVNGQRVGTHEGGMTSFHFDVTDALDDGEQVITVRVEDDPADVAQPRGKQDWRPETYGIFYERTSGIWQPVWCEQVDPVHLTEVRWDTDLDRGGVDATFRLSRPDPDATIRVRLRHDGQPLASVETSTTGDPSVPTRTFLTIARLGRPMERRGLLWSPEHPRLVDATVELVRDGRVVDRVDSYLGLRSCGFRDGHFLLNGQPYYLRMVLEQGYWPDSHLAAPDEDARRSEVELIKALGFNGARLHQKVEDPRFLYWCDRLGLAVWGEMANTFAHTEEACRRLVTEWMDVVRRDRNHPSIVAWIPMNESWGVPDVATSAPQQDFVTALYRLTRSMDPTRPTASNDGWEHTESDLWTIHDYTPSGDAIRDRYADGTRLAETLTTRGPGRRRVMLGEPRRDGQPIMITEFGGLSYAPSAGEKWFGYSTFTSDEDFAERFADLVSAILEMPGVAGFCYTQFSDTLQEANGLVRADRSPKLPVERIRAIVTQPAASIPSEAIDHYRSAAQRGTTPTGRANGVADNGSRTDGLAPPTPDDAERATRQP